MVESTNAEKMVVIKDYLGAKSMKELQSAIAGETVLFSTLIQQKAFMFFTKSKMVILTDTRILIATPSKKQVRFVNQYGDLHGVTKSLRIGANNIILHFGTRADEEWFCDKREELINVLS